jgi:hypothetical protein
MNGVHEWRGEIQMQLRMFINLTFSVTPKMAGKWREIGVRNMGVLELRKGPTGPELSITLCET